MLGTPQGDARYGRDERVGFDERSAYHLAHAHRTSANLAASPRAQAGNDFGIHGERGSIRSVAPFYRSHRLELCAACTPSSIRSIEAPQLRELWRMTTLQVDRKTHCVDERRPHNCVTVGIGFGFGIARQAAVATHDGPVMFRQRQSIELAVVTRCPPYGLLELPNMPLNESVSVTRTVDTLHCERGLDYPKV